jgi:hypothetical protein
MALLLLLLLLIVIFGLGGVVKGLLWAMLVAVGLVVVAALVATRTFRH